MTRARRLLPQLDGADVPALGDLGPLEDAPAVAIGDTFARVLPPLFPTLAPAVGEPWEVTDGPIAPEACDALELPRAVRWKLVRGADVAYPSEEALRNPRWWTRTRCL